MRRSIPTIAKDPERLLAASQPSAPPPAHRARADSESASTDGPKAPQPYPRPPHSKAKGERIFADTGEKNILPVNPKNLSFQSRRKVEEDVADHMAADRGSLGLGPYRLSRGCFGSGGPDRGVEDRLIRMIDDKTMLAKMAEEYLPIEKTLKGEKNADRILGAYQSLAAKTLVAGMLHGNQTEKRQAATSVLDRVLGKPIERKMTMALNVDGMSLAEVDNELKRLTSGSSGGEEAKIIEATFTEGEYSSGDEGGEVSAESDSESVSRLSEEDSSVNSGK